jgi:hypothetical protein
MPRPGVLAATTSPAATDVQELELPNGHFFKQANGFGGGADLGFAVVDDSGAAMWSEFQRLGGVDQLGYPISRRFIYRGSIAQVFEKGALRWVAEEGQAGLINTLDELSAVGDDAWLDANLQIPAAADWSADRGLTDEDVAARHLAVLDAYPELRDSLVADGTLDLYGLPTAAKAYGPSVVVRFQRATLQLWTGDTSLAPAGTKVIGSGAQLGKQIGLWPSDAMTPETPPVALSL